MMILVCRPRPGSGHSTLAGPGPRPGGGGSTCVSSSPRFLCLPCVPGSVVLFFENDSCGSTGVPVWWCFCPRSSIPVPVVPCAKGWLAPPRRPPAPPPGPVSIKELQVSHSDLSNNASESTQNIRHSACESCDRHSASESLFHSGLAASESL